MKFRVECHVLACPSQHIGEIRATEIEAVLIDIFLGFPKVRTNVSNFFALSFLFLTFLAFAFAFAFALAQFFVCAQAHHVQVHAVVVEILHRNNIYIYIYIYIHRQGMMMPGSETKIKFQTELGIPIISSFSPAIHA